MFDPTATNVPWWNQAPANDNIYPTAVNAIKNLWGTDVPGLNKPPEKDWLYSKLIQLWNYIKGNKVSPEIKQKYIDLAQRYKDWVMGTVVRGWEQAPWNIAGTNIPLANPKLTSNTIAKKIKQYKWQPKSQVSYAPDIEYSRNAWDLNPWEKWATLNNPMWLKANPAAQSLTKIQDAAATPITRNTDWSFGLWSQRFATEQAAKAGQERLARLAEMKSQALNTF